MKESASLGMNTLSLYCDLYCILGKHHNCAQEVKQLNATDTLRSARSAYGPGHHCEKQISIKLEEGLQDLKICIEDESLTCGWLIGEVTKRYAFLIE